MPVLSKRAICPAPGIAPPYQLEPLLQLTSVLPCQAMLVWAMGVIR